MKPKINSVSFDLLLEKIGKLEEQVRLLKSELKNVGIICNNLYEGKDDTKTETKNNDGQ
jgi:hypothetical protein